MTAIKLYADDRGLYRAALADDMTAPDNPSALLETMTAELLYGGDGYVQALPDGDGWHMLVVVPPHTAAGDYQSVLAYAMSVIRQFFAIGPDVAGWFRYGDDLAPGGWYMRIRSVELPSMGFLADVDLTAG